MRDEPATNWKDFLKQPEEISPKLSLGIYLALGLVIIYLPLSYFYYFLSHPPFENSKSAEALAEIIVLKWILCFAVFLNICYLTFQKYRKAWNQTNLWNDLFFTFFLLIQSIGILSRRHYQIDWTVASVGFVTSIAHFALGAYVGVRMYKKVEQR